MEEEIIFDCHLTDGEKRKFKKSNGLFEKGIKKVNTLTYEEQISRIRKLSFVKAFDPEKKIAKLTLEWAGDYVAHLMWLKPKVWRIEYDGRKSARNPFIRGSSHRLCLGTVAPIYFRCYNNHNYYECVKIIAAVLQSPDTDRTYRRWNDCGGYEHEKVYA